MPRRRHRQGHAKHPCKAEYSWASALQIAGVYKFVLASMACRLHPPESINTVSSKIAFSNISTYHNIHPLALLPALRNFASRIKLLKLFNALPTQWHSILHQIETKRTSPTPLALPSSPQHVHPQPPLGNLRRGRLLPPKLDRNHRHHNRPHSPQNLFLGRPVHLACKKTPPKSSRYLHGKLQQPVRSYQHAGAERLHASRTAAAAAGLRGKADVSGKEGRPWTDGVRFYR